VPNNRADATMQSIEMPVNKASPINIDANKQIMDVDNKTVFIALDLVQTSNRL
jgi:hypothetical protein